MRAFTLLLLFFLASQLYWAWRAYRWLARRVPARGRRLALLAVAAALWLLLFEHSFGAMRGVTHVSPHVGDWLLDAPFFWWTASSMVGFVVALLVAVPRAIGRHLRSRRDTPASRERRHFLEHAANVATAAPFFAGAYALFYGRLNLEVSHQTARLPKLPKAFEGFRIVQLSDIHIGPFMPAAEIRKYADIANSLKPGLIVLTGDFVTFDPRTQGAVVEALAGVRAPFGVFGCLGNHDMWARVEDSIAELFRRAGVRILRGERTPIAIGGDSFNLIGVDFQSPRRFGPSPAVARPLENIEPLIDRHRANILLSHNPDTFPRAARLGIELSIAGHTHGGQLALEFISPELSPTRFATPYVAGWFREPGGQLYVNRGIGTIGVPMRLGAPPEITVYTLAAGG